ncbi:hypothetical protein PC117_g20150 [Phytophthora cactorum]|uniref:Uncharacterized protein n=1 Tax=Phytophthora cactorum TaxID=29920 RepID=A0A8T1BRG7_9STRA|nr:hypothetical protein PC117_g20150 [Phytophthora cactorum]
MELDLNIDALNIFNLLSSFTPRPQKRKRGKWIDDSKTCCEGKKDKEKELRAKEKEERAKEWVQKAKQKADVKAARHAAKGERSSKKGIKSTALAETFVVLGTR